MVGQIGRRKTRFSLPPPPFKAMINRPGQPLIVCHDSRVSGGRKDTAAERQFASVFDGGDDDY